MTKSRNDRLICVHFIQRTRHGKTLFDFGRFGTDARVVRQLCHNLSVI